MSAVPTLDGWLSRKRLIPLAERLAPVYSSASPFPHCVIDDFLPPELLAELINEYPGPDDLAWGGFHNDREVKLACEDEEQCPAAVRQTLHDLNSQVFIEFLEALTGIEGVVPDPSLRGGGMHQIRSGGLLKIHADFNMHRDLHLERRINVLLYLNEDWDEAWGGDLQLWDKTMTSYTRIFPVANRMVVFTTTSDSYHGHPDPLACPPERTRRSLAWYYYTVPTAGMKGDHSTLFQPRRGEALVSPAERKAQRRGHVRAAIGLSLPPRLRNVARALVARSR